jgi:uncharacterized protein (DUF427 family)
MIRPKRVEPGPGQESVWDYPRPPRLEEIDRHIRIVFNGVTMVDTRHAWRVLETSHPPVYYIPPADIRMQYLARADGTSWCEWKGQAIYYTLTVQDKQVEKAAWSYPHPTSDFKPIKDYLAFYAGPIDGCYIDDEKVTAQPGGFYGGWITADIVGPFKGEAGSRGW